MSSNRLFGIMYHLLNTKKTTSAQLAVMFEVSTRTIYRDLNTLSSSGIPIYTEPGRNGGVYLLNQFVLDKVFLSKEEQANLLVALQINKKINPETSEQSLAKLHALFGSSLENWLEIDFSNWHQKEPINKKFNLLKTSILTKKQIKFDYISTKGALKKRICHPLKLLFKSQAWYLQAFCLQKEAFRFFKVSRIKTITLTHQSFVSIRVPEIKDLDRKMECISVSLSFSKEILYRVFDEFDHQDIAIQHDGTCIVTTELPNQEWLIRYLLSFGRHLTILEPSSVKHRMKQEIDELYPYL